MGIKPNDYKIVQVIWNDADSHDNWVDLKEVIGDTSMECITLGWLVADKPDRLVLVASIDLNPETERVSGHTMIPRAQVKEIKELAVKKPRKEKKIEQEPSNNPA